MKTYIYIGLVIGTFIGSKIPALWGAGSFSISGIILSVIFAIAGAVAGQKIYQHFH